MENVILVMPSVVTLQNFNITLQLTVSHFPFSLFCPLQCLCVYMYIQPLLDFKFYKCRVLFFPHFIHYWIPKSTTVSDT